MTSAQVSTAELPGGDGHSEDRVFAAANSVVVLDGVSPLESNGDRSGWYPDALGRRLAELLNTRPADGLREILAEAIADVAPNTACSPEPRQPAPWPLPAGDPDVLEGLVLADSPIVVFGTDGGIDILLRLARLRSSDQISIS